MLIPTDQNVKTITDMREDALVLLSLVQKKGLAYIFHHSKPKAVLLSINDFLTLQNLIEDLEDIRAAEELEKEPRGKLIPLKTIASKYV